MITELLPDLPFTLSHQLNPILREYRRASSTAIDASLKPLMQSYLSDLERDLRAVGYRNDILVSTSFGGVMHLNDVLKRPIYLVKSGPAMAPIAGLAYVEAEGLSNNVIVCDAGGTTFEVSLVRDGAVEYSRDTWLGPQSAGSEPGPACYGRGGEFPTVTDAAVALGYFDPEYFLGGRMHLDEAAARRVIGRIAETLKQSLERAAWAIVAVASENMIQAIKELTINEGIDPSESALIGGGGAGGLNIVPIVRELGCRTVLGPRTAGALSASGMQFSDIITEAGASKLTASDDFDFPGVNAALHEIDLRLEEFGSRLRQRGINDLEKRYFVEARYRFQVWELEVVVPADHFRDQGEVDALVREFHRVHDRVFAVHDLNNAVEFLNWRGRLIAKVNAPTLEPTRVLPDLIATPDRWRRCFFDTEHVDTAIYLGAKLPIGAVVVGPAIIEEETATLVILFRRHGSSQSGRTLSRQPRGGEST
ncbi:MAG: hydantoinase/oxoprolinase family protein [Gammaproteobacteria bacterium]|nr:hydantoinase/oxoprolinase family protein [Gammaproteobacteria bacterium]